MGDLGKVLLPIAATLILGAVGYLFSWAKDYSAAARRVRILDEETKRLAYWKAWKEIHNPADFTDRKLIGMEVKRSEELVLKIYQHWPLPSRWTDEKYVVYLNSLSPWRRFFLLHSKPFRYEWPFTLLNVLTILTPVLSVLQIVLQRDLSYEHLGVHPRTLGYFLQGDWRFLPGQFALLLILRLAIAAYLRRTYQSLVTAQPASFFPTPRL